MRHGSSPVVKICMEFYLFPSIPTPMKLWAGYVNDVSVLFPNDHNQNYYFISLNVLSDSIEFTVEAIYDQKFQIVHILVRTFS